MGIAEETGRYVDKKPAGTLIDLVLSAISLLLLYLLLSASSNRVCFPPQSGRKLAPQGFP